MARGGPATNRGRQGDEESQSSGGGTINWTQSVDRLLESSPALVSAVRAAFIRFQDPKTNTLPPDSLLPALQLLFQRATEELDTRAQKLFFRPVIREDLDCVAEENADINIDEPIDFETFHIIAKKVLKRILLNQGKRLGLFMIGGIVVVHVVKGIVRHLPFVGPTVGAVINSLVPTVLVGPAVGVAGALCT